MVGLCFLMGNREIMFLGYFNSVKGVRKVPQSNNATLTKHSSLPLIPAK